jgi:hypothetical protein
MMWVVVEERAHPGRSGRHAVLWRGQGAPGPERDGHDDALSPDIRQLILSWGGDVGDREDAERISEDAQRDER